MKFWIAIEPGTEDTAWGVVAPDLPGCFSAGDTLDEAMHNARDAIDLWCQTVIEDGGVIPSPGLLSDHQLDPDFAGWVFGVVEVPVEQYLGPAEKINITLPRVLLAKVDEYASAHGESRSGLLARAVQSVIGAPVKSRSTKKFARSRPIQSPSTKTTLSKARVRKVK